MRAPGPGAGQVPASAADDARLPERRTHDYARHGTTSLFAAFNIPHGNFHYLTDSQPAGLHTVHTVEPTTINVPSRGGRTIPALTYRPHGGG